MSADKSRWTGSRMIRRAQRCADLKECVGWGVFFFLLNAIPSSMMNKDRIAIAGFTDWLGKNRERRY